MNNQEYVIINKTAIQKRIAELETKKLKNPHSAYYTHPLDVEIDTLKQILSQSTPLIPEIEKAMNAAREIQDDSAHDTLSEQFTTSLVECDICTHIWVAVRPIETTELECPNCHHITFIEGGNNE